MTDIIKELKELENIKLNHKCPHCDKNIYINQNIAKSWELMFHTDCFKEVIRESTLRNYKQALAKEINTLKHNYELEKIEQMEHNNSVGISWCNEIIMDLRRLIKELALSEDSNGS